MRAAIVVALAAAACSGKPLTACPMTLPQTTLYDSYCPSAPQGICFVDHPTDL